MTKRKTLSRLARTRIFDAHQGTCCICDCKIDPIKSKVVIEHINPLWRGGADDERNMAPAHFTCAIEKTKQEAPLKAKSDRIRATERGIKKTKRHRWGYGKDDPMKKKITGELVPREQ